MGLKKMSSIDTVTQNWFFIKLDNYYSVEITVFTSRDKADSNFGGAKNVYWKILSRRYEKFLPLMGLLFFSMEVYTHLFFLKIMLRKFIALKFDLSLV